MVDVLVLDEADRMIADGHFKELRDIMAHIYTKRVQLKRGIPLKDRVASEKQAAEGKALAAAVKTQTAADFFV
jgi:superfamily II DNA/RNA helicase